MSFGLNKKTVKQLKSLFKKYPKISQVKIYGSRARGDYRRGSDIDLAFFSESKQDLSLRLSWKLKALPTLYLFDIVNYQTLSNISLKKEIDKYGKVFYLRDTKIQKNSVSSRATGGMNVKSVNLDKVAEESPPDPGGQGGNIKSSMDPEIAF